MASESGAWTERRPAGRGRFARGCPTDAAQASLYALTSAIDGERRADLEPRLRAAVDEAEAAAILDDLFGPEIARAATRARRRAIMPTRRFVGLALVSIGIVIAAAVVASGTGRPAGANGHATAGQHALDPALFEVRSSTHGLVMNNVVNGVSAQFSRQGAVLRIGGFAWLGSLRSIGYGERLAPVAMATPTGTGNRVLFSRGPVSEWYVNGPRGLEQGFTILRPPTGPASGPLTLAIGLPASVEVAVAPDGHAMTVYQGARQLFRYGDVAAADARGRSLPVWMQSVGGFLLLSVDDRGARYPILIDPRYLHP